MYLCRVKDTSEKYNTKKRTPMKAVRRDREDAREKQKKRNRNSEIKQERERERDDGMRKVWFFQKERVGEEGPGGVSWKAVNLLSDYVCGRVPVAP